jgi:hypothetical protein
VSIHESHRPSQPGGNPEGALQSAARQLGGTTPSGGKTPARERRILQGRQERDLEHWAKEVGCWLNPEVVLQGFTTGGEEHRICRGDLHYKKATYPGRYGFTVILANDQPTLVHALPSEYLDRLLLANRVFDDDIRLLGITCEDAGLVIVTSQPTIVGDACTAEEMISWFQSRGFSSLAGFSAGYRGALSFYRVVDHVAVFDAHPANFLRDRNDIVLPIDAVLVQAAAALAAALEVLC